MNAEKDPAPSPAIKKSNGKRTFYVFPDGKECEAGQYETEAAAKARILGNTKTPGLPTFLRPGKWIHTSAGNSRWLSDAQNGHGIQSLQLRKPLYGELHTLSVRTVTGTLCDLAHISVRNENETIQLDA